MNKPRHISVKDWQWCQDPDIEAKVVWDEEDKEFLAVKAEGIPNNFEESSLLMWGFSGKAPIPPKIQDTIYMYDDLYFEISGDAFPFIKKGQWYWAYPGEVKRSEDPEDVFVALTECLESGSDLELTELIAFYGMDTLREAIALHQDDLVELNKRIP